MRDLIYVLMTDYANGIVFLHILGAVVWVGGMFSIRYMKDKPLKNIKDPQDFINELLRYKHLFFMTFPFIVILFVTAVIMALGYHDSTYDADGFILDPDALKIMKMVHTKGIIWTVMAMNMMLMAWLSYKAYNNLTADTSVTKQCSNCGQAIWIIYTYLMPINIVLGIIELFLGVILRNVF